MVEGDLPAASPSSTSPDADDQLDAEAVGDPEERVDRDVCTSLLDAGVVPAGHPDLLGQRLLRDLGGETSCPELFADLGSKAACPRTELRYHKPKRAR